MLRVALAGAGSVADLHIRAMKKNPGYELAGIYDIRPALAQGKAAAAGIRAYASLEEIFSDPHVDAIFVLTHSDSHLDIASRALQAGKHVLVEKPVSQDAEGIEAIVDQARAAGLVCIPNHNYSHIPEFRRLKRMADAGELGTIRSFFVSYVIPHTEEVASRYGGILEEVMIHHSYLSLSVLGKPDRIFAGAAKPAWKSHRAEDQAWMVWEYEPGTSAHLFASFATDDFTNEPWTCIVKALGTDGSVVVNWRTAMARRAIGTHAIAYDQYEESFTDVLASFRDAVLSGAAVPSTMTDAATAARIIRLAYGAARSHSAVSRTDNGDKQLW